MITYDKQSRPLIRGLHTSDLVYCICKDKLVFSTVVEVKMEKTQRGKLSPNPAEKNSRLLKLSCV
jgi:hypothetical protein